MFLEKLEAPTGAEYQGVQCRVERRVERRPPMSDSSPLPPPRKRKTGRRAAAAAAAGTKTLAADPVNEAETKGRAKGMSAQKSAGVPAAAAAESVANDDGGSGIANPMQTASHPGDPQRSRERSRLARLARLAKLRAKTRQGGSAPHHPRRHERRREPQSDGSIELVVLSPVMPAAPATALRGGGGHGHSSSPHGKDGVDKTRVDFPPHPRLSLGVVSWKDRFVSACLSLVVLLVAVTSIVLVSQKGDSPAALNCARIFLPVSVAALYFPAYFLMAVVFRPSSSGSALLASVKRRRIFSVGALLFVSSAAILSASIGSPHGLCPNECACGVCDLSVSADKDSSTMQPTDQNNAKAAKGPLMCSEPQTTLVDSGRIYKANNSRSGGEGCYRSVGEGVSIQRICSTSASDDGSSGVERVSRVASSENIDGVNGRGRLLAMLISTLAKEEKVDVNALPFAGGADSGCSENLNLECPTFSGPDAEVKIQAWLTLGVITNAVPILCDSVYTYCDRQNQPRRACANADAVRCATGHQRHLHASRITGRASDLPTRWLLPTLPMIMHTLTPSFKPSAIRITSLTTVSREL